LASGGNWLTPEEATAVMNALDCATLIGCRDRALLALPAAGSSRAHRQLQRCAAQMGSVAATGLPDTIQFFAGCVAITRRDLTHLVEQLVLLAKALDTHYELLLLREGSRDVSLKTPG
jgi:hypothetical protein